MMNQFTLYQSGNIGQEIISPNGNILAWTTNPVFGAFIVRILNAIYSDNEPLEAIFGDEDIWHERVSTNKSLKSASTNNANPESNEHE